MRRSVSVRVVRRGRDEEFDPAFWKHVSPDERFAEAWRLTEEIWRLKGWDPGEPRLSRSLLRALSDAGARFLVVGAYAVSFHAEPRATGDLDVWIDRSSDNAARVYRALGVFGAPLSQLTERDLADADTVFQIGVAPRRIDIMTSITGVEFAEAWERRSHGNYDDVRFPLIGLHALIKNKLAVGRPQDLLDVELLRRHHPAAE